MKKIILALACALLSVMVVNSEERPIKTTDLPVVAQQFLSKHFADRTILSVTQDTDMLDGDFKVRFDDGTEVEFNRKGLWTDVTAKDNGVPTTIIPPTILRYLTTHYDGQRVVEIEYTPRLKGIYEVKLASQLELKFDGKGNYLSMD